MRLLHPAVLVGVLLAPPPASTQEWIEFQDRSDFFFVNFPGKPVVTTITYEPQRGPMLPGRVYTVQDGPRRYSVTVIDYAKASVNDVPGAVGWEAWNFRKRGGEITYDAYGQVDRIGGHQLHVKNTDGTQSFIGIYLHARRLYVLEARVPPGSPGAVHFQQSLMIFDDKGERVRYKIEPDGTRGARETEYDPVTCH
jgi:hypothetical protein